MVKLKWILLCGILALAGGCQWALMDQADFAAVHESVGILSGQVDGMQTVMVAATAADEDQAAKAAKLNEEIDKSQKIMLDAADAIKDAPNIIEAAIGANQATAPVNPYAPIIDAVLKIIAASGVIGTGLGVKKVVAVGKENSTNKAKLKATNVANEFLRLAHPEIAKEHYELVGDKRTVAGV